MIQNLTSNDPPVGDVLKLIATSAIRQWEHENRVILSESEFDSAMMGYALACLDFLSGKVGLTEETYGEEEDPEESG